MLYTSVLRLELAVTMACTWRGLWTMQAVCASWRVRQLDWRCTWMRHLRRWRWTTWCSGWRYRMHGTVSSCHLLKLFVL